MEKRWLMVTCLLISGVAWADDPLDEAAVAQARQQAQDAPQVGDFFRGAGEKTDYQVLLDANKCYWFSAVSQNMRKLYLYLWKPNSNFFTPRVADARSDGQATMAYCTQESGMFKLQVKTEGKGHFVIGVFAKTAPPPAAPAPPVAAPAPVVMDVGPLCDKTAAGSAPGAKRELDYFSGFGSSIGRDDRSDYTVLMQAGRCYWVIGCGEPEKVKSLYLYLWGPDNKRVSESKSDNPNPMVGTCAQVTGMYKLQAKMNGGKGNFKVGVYVK